MFSDHTVLHEVNVIRLVQDVESVRDENAGLPRKWSVHNAVIHDGLSDVSIDGAQRIIQQDNIGIGVSCAGERDSSLRKCQ